MRQPSLYLPELWRTNTVAVAAIAVAGFVLLAGALWFASSGSGRASAEAYEYRLAHSSLPLAGSHQKLFALERWEKDSAEPSGASVNLLIVDDNDASSRWMFPDNGQIILTRDELHASEGPLAPVTGLMLTVASTSGHSESLYYWRAGGGPATRILTADAIVSGDQAGADRYLVITRNGARTAAALYSLIDFRLLAQKPAPDMPQ